MSMRLSTILILALALTACGGGAASSETASAPETTPASSGAETSGPSAASGPATDATVAALAAREVTSGRARVHGHAVQLQESGGSILEIEIGAAQTSDEQPKVYCRPGDAAPIASTAVQWMAELTVEGTIDASGDRVMLRDCVLAP